MKSAPTHNNAAHAKLFFADKMAFTTGPVEVQHGLEQGEDLAIFDLREAEDFATGHVPGAKNLPRAQWVNTEVLRRDTNNILYCYSTVCHLAAAAAVEFAGRGFSVVEMEGGFKEWKENGLPIEK